MVEGARLESVCTPKGYRGFESRSLRKTATPFCSEFKETVRAQRELFPWARTNLRLELKLELWTLLRLAQWPNSETSLELLP